MQRFDLADDVTLTKYVSSLSDADKQLLQGVPLTVDEYMDLDLDVEGLNQLKVGTGLGLTLTEEQQAKRSDHTDKIMYLQMHAVLDDEAKSKEWFSRLQLV